MFYKLFALFALVAVAMAAPKAQPEPQVLTYTSGLDYLYPGAVPSVVSPYTSPLAYAGLPGGAYYYR